MASKLDPKLFAKVAKTVGAAQTACDKFIAALPTAYQKRLPKGPTILAPVSVNEGATYARFTVFAVYELGVSIGEVKDIPWFIPWADLSVEAKAEIIKHL